MLRIVDQIAGGLMVVVFHRVLIVEGERRDIFLIGGCDEDEDEDRIAFGFVDRLRFEICIYAMRS